MYLIYKNMPFLQLLINLPLILSGILIKSLFFLKKGFAGEYLRGIGAGITGCRECKKCGSRGKSGKLRGHTAGLVGQCDPDSGRKINLIVKQIFKILRKCYRMFAKRRCAFMEIIVSLMLYGS